MGKTKAEEFESFFRSFAISLGAEPIQETNAGPTADYFFPKANVIAELKTLVADQKKVIDGKLSERILAWVRKNGLPSGMSIVDGTPSLAIKDAPEEIQAYWLELLTASIEPMVRSANSQIRGA